MAKTKWNRKSEPISISPSGVVKYPGEVAVADMDMAIAALKSARLNLKSRTKGDRVTTSRKTAKGVAVGKAWSNLMAD
jgi:hypothetical protein